MNIEEARNHVINKAMYLVGVSNNLFPLLILFIGCFNSDFTCHGDRMGGIMMLYALVFYIPQMVIFVVVALYFSIVCYKANQKDIENIYSKRDRYFIITYLLSIAGVIVLVTNIDSIMT